MIVEKNGNLLAYSMNGQESRVLFAPKEALDWEIRENDHITFSEVNVIGEELYAKIRYTYTSNYMTPLELQFLQDEIGAFYGSNGTEICGVVNWTPEEGFVLSEITGRQS